MLPKGDRRLKSNKDSADFHEIKTLSREFLLFAASRNLPSFVRGYYKKGWRITSLVDSGLAGRRVLGRHGRVHVSDPSSITE